jgi:hypothetical protein
MRLCLTVLTVGVLIAPALLSLLPPASARGRAGEVVISQLYVGGGSGDAPLNADFVELFNRGSDPVSLDGWSMQYARRRGGHDRCRAKHLACPGQP